MQYKNKSFDIIKTIKKTWNQLEDVSRRKYIKRTQKLSSSLKHNMMCQYASKIISSRGIFNHLFLPVTINKKISAHLWMNGYTIFIMITVSFFIQKFEIWHRSIFPNKNMQNSLKFNWWHDIQICAFKIVIWQFSYF